MAVDATRLRRAVRRLGEPPTDSSPALSDQAPTDAPSDAATVAAQASSGVGASAPVHAREPSLSHLARPRLPSPADAPGTRGYIDGRSRRRTGRIEQINVKVSAQFNTDLRGLADREGLLIVEVLEHALDAYLRVIAAAEASGQTVGQVLDALSRP